MSQSDLGSMTEDLIGFDESMAGDPLSELLVLQSRLRALRREARLWLPFKGKQGAEAMLHMVGILGDL